MRSVRLAHVALAFLSFATAARGADLPQPPGRTVSPSLVEAGRSLFVMNFARPEEELGRHGNGLGPVFNDTSCVGCHNQGGVGGGGTLDSNVMLIGIVSRPKRPANLPAAVEAAQKIHSQLSANSSVAVLHKFALGFPENVEAYDKWRDDLLTTMGVENSLNSVRPVRKNFGAVTLEIAQRNTPPLWGLGQLDKFRSEGGDVFRRRLAQEKTECYPWITGRIPKTPAGQEGWFGYRGQVDTLDNFVLSACATEMGLQVPGFKETAVPIDLSQPVSRNASRKKAVDLTEAQCTALAAFVHNLPRPRTSEGDSSEEIVAGQRVFERIGCSHCHVPDLGWVKGVFSDMLLHDMGYEEQDVQTAAPDHVVRTWDPAGTGYYTVSFLAESDTNPEQEWKTPPLWGVGDSAPYFHDGRAATLNEAIEIHAGEAERSATAFRQLDEDDQQALLAFLASLKAPAESHAVAAR